MFKFLKVGQNVRKMKMRIRLAVLILFFGEFIFANNELRNSENLSSKEGLKNTINALTADRSGKFLFDAIFRISSSITNAFGYEGEEYSDYNEDINIKTCECDCGYSNEEIRIVGGRPTGINQYPWMARIVYDGKFHCGGSLLTKEYVLTAAHCVKKLRKSKIRIIFGDHDQHITSESKAIQRAVSAIIKHRNFNPDSYNNDIALLKLRKPMTFSKIIKPVCLPRFNYDPAGIIQSFKSHYRKCLVREQILAAEGGIMAKFLKSISILRALFIIKRTWWLVTPQIIQNCFKKAGIHDGIHVADSLDDINSSDVQVYCETDGSASDDVCETVDYETFFKNIVDLEKENCFGAANDDDIINEIQEDEIEENSADSAMQPSREEALHALFILKQYLNDNIINTEQILFNERDKSLVQKKKN
nr:trypsin zeta-like [Bactrocera oleae]